VEWKHFKLLSDLIYLQVFIGLFAGAQHKLKLEQRRGGKDKPPAGTVTVTSTQVTTATTTRITTTTALPGPSPTKVPVKVSA
jgi:endothelin-converting enzyme